MRAALALSLLAGFYLLVLGVVVTDIAVMIMMVVTPTSGNTDDQARLFGIPSNSMTFIAASAPLLVAIFYGVFTVSWPHTRIAGSVLLPRTRAAELWETVEELAEQVGTLPPTEIRLIGEANAMVSEESYLLGLLPGRSRVLYVGAPLLVALRADELRAVLSHELGHYARKHTRLAAIVYRGSASLNATLERLVDAGGGRRRLVTGLSYLVYFLLSRYAKLYRRLAFATNRRQELEADAAAARIVGPEIIAEALRAVHATTVSWQAFEGRILAPMHRSGRLPDDPFSAYQAMLEDPHHRDEFARLRYVIPQEADKPLDSHPSLARRLHTLGGLPDEIVDLDPRPALDLFLDYQDSFGRVRSNQFHSKLRPIPWQDWLALAAQSRAIEPARALKRAEARLAKSTANAGRPLLAAVLARLEAGQGRELARHLDDDTGYDTDTDADADADADESDYPDRLLAALLSLVGQGLVENGAATWRLSWTGASVLIPRDVTADELVRLLAAALDDPLEVPRLRLRLASLGLAEQVQIPLGEKAAQPSSLTVTPLIDDNDASRRRGMAIAAVGTMIGLLIVLAIVGTSTAGKRSQIADALYGSSPQTLPSPLDLNSYNYDYGYSAPPAYTSPYPILPSINPYDLLPVMPSYDLIPTDFVPTITVRSGETLTSIARDCDTTIADLQRVNNMGSSTLLNAGQTLKVPGIGVLLPAACH